MKQKNQFQLNIGLSSILLIFVALSLVSFAILSLVTANADKKLSLKMMERNKLYYEACNQFESDCAKIHTTLINAYQQSENADEYYQSLGEQGHLYQYPLSELQDLEIYIEYCYPSNLNEPLYQITSRKVITDDNIDYDTHLSVIP